MEKYIGIVLEKNSNEHLYVQLYKKLRTLIFNSSLKAHEKMPPIRKMAELLGVNNVTIVNAYKLLEEDSLIYKKIGSGTFVSPVYDDQLNRDIEDNSKYKYDFGTASPTPEMFPVEKFKIVMNEVLDKYKGHAFGYQESKGFFGLRESIADYIKDFNLNYNSEDIQIVSGAQQGIDLVSKSILDYGDYVFVEAPTYSGAIASFKLRGVNVIEIKLEEDGIDIEFLIDQLKKYKPKLLYLMANFQNPTGISYSDEKKIKIAKLAKEYNFWVVEDDFASELSYTNKKAIPLKSFDDFDKVIYIKSFSKIFMPGLRLGFMIVPELVADEILLAKHAADISTSGLLQKALNLYIRKGYLREQVDHLRAIFEKRYSITTIILKENLPNGCSFIESSGGLNFWITLPKSINMEQFYLEINSLGVYVIAGSVYFNNKVKSNSFRLSIAGIEDELIEEGLEIIIKEILKQI